MVSFRLQRIAWKAHVPRGCEKHWPNWNLLDISVESSLRLSWNALKLILCQVKKVVGPLAHRVNLATDIGNWTTHLVGKFLHKGFLVGVDYLQSLNDDGFALGEGELLVGAEGIFGGLGDLADLVERLARMFEDDFPRGRRDGAHLVCHFGIYKWR